MPRGVQSASVLGLPKPWPNGYRKAMTRHGLRLAQTVGTLAAASLLAGCTFALWDRPPAQPEPSATEDIRATEGSVLTGLFTRTPVDLPDAVPIATLREAVVERAYGGVILRVTGVAPTQGFHGATLRPENGGLPDAAGILTVALVAVPPSTPEAVGPERARLLLTAAFLQERELRDIRGFRVVAGQNVVTLPLR